MVKHTLKHYYQHYQWKNSVKEDLKELYNYRWTIETDYDRLKNILELENFTGQRKIIIEQDLFSKIFILNLLLTIKMDANRHIHEKIKT